MYMYMYMYMYVVHPSNEGVSRGRCGALEIAACPRKECTIPVKKRPLLGERDGGAKW